MTNERSEELRGTEGGLNELREVVATEGGVIVVDPSKGSHNAVGLENVKPGDTLYYDGGYCIGFAAKPPIKIANSKRWGRGVRNRR